MALRSVVPPRASLYPTSPHLTTPHLSHLVASRRVTARLAAPRPLKYEVQTNFIFEAARASILLHSRIHLSLLRHDSRQRCQPINPFVRSGNKRRVLMDLRAASIFPLSRLILFARKRHEPARVTTLLLVCASNSDREANPRGFSATGIEIKRTLRRSKAHSSHPANFYIEFASNSMRITRPSSRKYRAAVLSLKAALETWLAAQNIADKTFFRPKRSSENANLTCLCSTFR